MAYILIQSKWTRQPTSPVGINWNSPLALGLSGLWNFGQGISGANRNLVSLEAIGANSNTSFGIGPHGGAAETTNAADKHHLYLAASITSVITATAGTVAVWRRKKDTTNRIGRIIGNSENYYNIGLWCPYSDGNLYWGWGGTLSSQGGLTFGDDRIVASAGAEMRVVQNGRRVLTNAATPSAATTGALILGSDPAFPSSENADLHHIFTVATWKRQLSDAEAAAWCENPWQLFQPIQRSIYVPSAGTSGVSGTSAGTFTATGTAAGTVAVSATSAATVSLTGAAAGAVEVKGTSAATVTATGSATGSVGSVPISATSAGTFTASGAAAGNVAVKGTSAGTIAATGAAAGTLAVKGTSAGAFDLLGAAAGAVGNVPVVGTSSATLTVSGAAAGAVQVQGTSAAQIALSGAAAAQIRIDGTSAIAVSVTGSAFATSQGALQATSAGVFALTGAATAVLWSRDDIDGTGRTRIGRGRTGSVSGGIGRGGSARGRIGPGRP